MVSFRTQKGGPVVVALSLRAQNIGIDLGTANTIVYLENELIVTLEPSVVAKNTIT